MIRIAPLLVLILATAPVASVRAQVTARDLIGRETRVELKDAIVLALENNLALVVRRADALTASALLRQAQGAYDPLVSGSWDRGKRETPNASVVQSFFGSGSETKEDFQDYLGGLSGVLPYGLSYSSAYSLGLLESTSGFNSLDPEWRAAWVTRLSIPLLKNLGINEIDVLVDSSELLRDASEETFRLDVMRTVEQVENAYWQVTAARERERVAEKSLSTAADLLEQVKVQYEVGVVSRVRIAESEAGVAEREFDAITARNEVGNAQDDLLSLTLAPGPAGYEDTVLITTNPTFVAYDVDEKSSLEKALERRPELTAARKLLEEAELQLALARNQLLPQLDLVSSYTRSGISGREKLLVNSTPPPALIRPNLSVGRGASSADDDFLHGGPRSWSLGLEFSIPLTNTTARGRHTQRTIELRRADVDYRLAEQDVVVSTRTAVRRIRNSIDAVRAAERRKAAQEETLRAEQERLRLGDSTPHDVLEFEEDLAEAERQVVGALQVYRSSIVELERAQGTLLESRGISMRAELERGGLDR